MAKSPKETPRPEKVFPVSWDQFHRDSRALAWRLHESGPFEASVCITRGGLVPAAIGNAVFDATGVRLRRVPFTPARVKAAIERA